ncbi:hypothetical protein S83_029257, partial [Arachis hypogaea]
ALAAEMAPNTRVNCIAPDFVPSNFASFIISYQSLSYCSRSWTSSNLKLVQNETLLSDWKQQQERDVEIMKAQSNVVSIRT